MNVTRHPGAMLLPTIRYKVPTRQPNIAVLLNGNARKVRPSLIKKLNTQIPFEHIYYSTTMEEAEQCCREIYEKKYDIVFTGGGDGTLMNCVTQLQTLRAQDILPKPLPVIGVLHLGTGNAVASILQADSRVLPDLAQARSGSGFAIRPQHWVTVNDQQAPFAGFGYDSLILNHYRRLKQVTAHTPFSFLGHGALGYFIAIACMAIPEALFRRRPQVEVINEGSPAFLLGAQGQPVQEFAPGDVLYEGEAAFVGAGTVPCFGYQFRVFPFATSGHHMNLRVANVSALEAAANMPSLWRGTWRHPQLFDFHVDRVRIRYKEAQPIQVGGDAVGFTNEAVFALSAEPTFLADLSPARNRPALQPIPA